MITYRYDAYGNTTKSNNTLNNPYQYNAEYTDSSTGLQYLRARYYDSSQGRFTAKDTYLGNVEYPLSRNLYAYCYNNPLNYTDPSGHIGVLAALAIGVGVGAVVGAVSGGISNAISQHKSSGEFDSKSFWRSVGIGAAAGAVGGLVGGGAGVATGAIIGAAGGSTTGIAAGAAIGAASGISGGMAYRYTGTKLNNSINGANDSALKAAYNPVGITVDGILEGLGGAISAGVTSGKIKNPFKNTSGTRGEQQSAKAYIESVKKYCGENGAEYHKAQKVESPVDIPEETLINNYNNAQKGWHVGDPIDKLTSAGKEPAWSTVRQRYWKNEAFYNAESYSAENLARMQKGLAPQRVNPLTGELESMELHHIDPQRNNGPNTYDNLEKLWPDEHAAIDEYRHTGR